MLIESHTYREYSVLPYYTHTHSSKAGVNMMVSNKDTTGVLVVVLVFIFMYMYIQPVKIFCKESMKLRQVKEEKAFMELHTVVTFPLLSNASRQLEGYRQYKLVDIKARMEEYMTSLRRTLDHQYVSNVHFLYDKSDIVEYVKSRVQHNAGKLSFHKIQGKFTAKSVLEFSFAHLQGKLVVVTQADVYPVEGFDLLKVDEMISKKVMYAVTRNARLEKNCDLRQSSTCHPKKYSGSHDTYIFVPTAPLAKKELEKLAIPVDGNGVDNIYIWYFRSVLKYKVLNPCFVIKMYHLHCTSFRRSDRKRYNKGPISATARPTSELF